MVRLSIMPKLVRLCEYVNLILYKTGITKSHEKLDKCIQLTVRRSSSLTLKALPCQIKVIVGRLDIF